MTCWRGERSRNYCARRALIRGPSIGRGIEPQPKKMWPRMSDDFDLGKLIFGDHKCFHCEHPIKSGEQHIEVPADDYLQKEMPDAAAAGSGFAAMGLDATIFFCSNCTIESNTGYTPEAHTIDVKIPDTIPTEWST